MPSFCISQYAAQLEDLNENRWEKTFRRTVVQPLERTVPDFQMWGLGPCFFSPVLYVAYRCPIMGVPASQRDECLPYACMFCYLIFLSYFFLSHFYFLCGSVAEWLGSRTCDQQVAGSNPGRRAAECNPGQVVYTHAPLSPSSIIWYRPVRGNAWLLAITAGTNYGARLVKLGVDTLELRRLRFDLIYTYRVLFGLG